MQTSASKVPIAESTASPAPRLFYIDNLRWTMIILVVSMHAAVTCSGIGSWYYLEKLPLSKTALLCFATYQSYLQAFFMALLFLVAGYFVPASYDRKGFIQFLRDRAYRLGLPLLLYMFLIGPVTEYYVAHSWRPSGPSSFYSEWIKHIRDGEILGESGPLWFCLALLIFCLIYATCRAITPLRVNPGPSLPGTGRLVLFIAAISAASFLVRLVQPAGSSFLNLQLANFSQYVALFLAGILAFRGGWFDDLSYRYGMRWLTLCFTLGLASWAALIAFGGALTGNVRAYGGGFHWQAAAFNVWESFTCVAIILGLLVLYRRHFNRRGPLEKFLSDNAFSVYVFHPPVLIAFSRLIHPLTLPPSIRFAVLTVAAVGVTYLLSAAVFRRVPLLRAILS